MDKPLIIAYYLPQFHPIPENNLWWGDGFTEWTNVGKAKPLFEGHHQPRVPADLGYYDIRIPEVREKQADLAREAGVSGFCYWHYWFNGKQLMNEIIDEVASTGKPDFPFCLGWANESWYKKLWNKDSKDDILLIEQTYGGIEDYRNHFEYAVNLFKNPNYIRINGKPFFLIYRPDGIPDIETFISLWNKWIKEENVADEIYFVANAEDTNRKQQYINSGFSAVTPGPNPRVLRAYEPPSWIQTKWNKVFCRNKKKPMLIKMSNVNSKIIDYSFDIAEDVIPVLYPQWDHSPRSGEFVFIVTESTPDMFGIQATNMMKLVCNKDNKLILLKSWNEWAEGNYMEPDLLYGKGYINALRNSISNI